MWNLIDGRFSDEISAYGDTLHINFAAEIADATTANYTIGSDVSVDSLAISQVDLLIDRYIRKGIGVQDALKAQSSYALRSVQEGVLSRFLDRAKDEEVMRKAVAGFTVNTAVTASGTSGVLAFADIVNAMTELDMQNVPETERYIVINSAGRGDLRQIPQFTSYKEVGEAGLVKTTNGYVGELYNAPVYVSNAVVTASSKYQFLVFHKSAIIGATQTVPKVEFYRDVLKGQDDLIAGELFGVKVLRPDHGLIIKRTVTAASV